MILPIRIVGTLHFLWFCRASAKWGNSWYTLRQMTWCQFGFGRRYIHITFDGSLGYLQLLTHTRSCYTSSWCHCHHNHHHHSGWRICAFLFILVTRGPRMLQAACKYRPSKIRGRTNVRLSKKVYHIIIPCVFRLISHIGGILVRLQALLLLLLLGVVTDILDWYPTLTSAYLFWVQYLCTLTPPRSFDSNRWDISLL